ncbi:NUMOD4 domain-containing protein [Chryseobacterium sp. MYb328]|uniref:NUMOD4 domain-containing protein n=1 Tax=Chryseobacterium sp. MYb328 TaxID=2745231 RepID=UPI0030ACF10C
MKSKYKKVAVSERLPEVWKDAVGYEDLYQVSNHGNVRSKDRIVHSKTGRPMLFKSRMQKLTLNRIGYYTVCFRARTINLNKTITVHRLVAQAFIKNDNCFPVINHKDLDPLNNYFENLEWCTQSHNIKHAISHGLIVKSSFEYKNSQLNAIQVMEIKELFKSSEWTNIKIAKKYNVSHQIISKLKHGRTYKNV